MFGQQTFTGTKMFLTGSQGKNVMSSKKRRVTLHCGTAKRGSCRDEIRKMGPEIHPPPPPPPSALNKACTSITLSAASSPHTCLVCVVRKCPASQSDEGIPLPVNVHPGDDNAALFPPAGHFELSLSPQLEVCGFDCRWVFWILAFAGLHGF